MHEQIFGRGGADMVGKQGVKSRKAGEEELGQTAKAGPSAIATADGRVEVNVADIGLTSRRAVRY